MSKKFFDLNSAVLIPTRWKEFQGVCARALIVKIQENRNTCIILKYKVFTIKALEFRHVSTLCGPSVRSVHQCLYRSSL